MPGIVVFGAQWGDEGKGRFVDYLAAEADVVVRYQGGNNAGHTIKVDGRVYQAAPYPCGIIVRRKAVRDRQRRGRSIRAHCSRRSTC